MNTLSIATNKHVLEGADAFVIRIHLADENYDRRTGEFAAVEVALDASRKIEHPDPEVDLCSVLIGDLISPAESRGIRFFLRALSVENVPPDWEDFDPVEDIVMAGCPNGLFDEISNMPLVRRGITATSLANRYDGRDEFMVDMACFPGSSGSPVFLNVPRGVIDRQSGVVNGGGRRLFFLGIMYAGPLITNEGTIVLSQQPSVQVAAMMHLGQVMRSSRMAELDEFLRDRSERRA